MANSTPARYMVTSALPYANGPIHVGHIAGAYLPADIYVRYLRARGRDVVWVCGSDEHGAAITLRARKEGCSPSEIVDRYHAEMQAGFAGLGIDFDHYDRTSAQHHHAFAQEFFKTLNDKGTFEVETRQQYFDEQEKQFLADRYIKGTCPKCKSDGAYGDQCEACGSALSPDELIDPTSTLSGDKPVLKETSHWYLPMGRHEEWLRDYIENGILDGEQHHDAKAWKAHVKGQCRSWIDGGLQSRAMTRDLDWGVKVPVEGGDGKVLYVWLDAPLGYITATQQWAEKTGRDWKPFWQDPDTQLVHFIGKDNIVFHCIIFPILLREHGGYLLPHNVPANEFMNLEGAKISTSRNWAVWANDYMEAFPGRADEMRYVLASIMPEQRDAEFTWHDFQARVNNELADVLGNFVNRVLVLTSKYFDGEAPAISTDLTGVDEALLAHINAAPEAVSTAIERYRFREALQETMGLVRAGNKYLTEEEPWKVFKTDPDRVRTTLNLALQVTATAAVLLEPFMPDLSAKLSGALGTEAKTWDDAGDNLVTPGTALGKLPILFEKITPELVEEQVALLGPSAEEAGLRDVPAQKAETSFDQFQSMDLRVAEVTAAEKVKGADKLLKLTVRTGLDERTVVSGIAEHFKPEDVVGRQVTLLVNLAPRKIRGVMSQGMVLMASTEDGGLRFVTPDEGALPGDTIS
jgi:methionyl-tRNA synthetase